MVLVFVSEVYGRYWIFFGFGIVLVFGILGCVLLQNLGSMLVLWFIVGSLVVVYVIVMGGVIGDVFCKEDCNMFMVMYLFFIMIGMGLGLMVSGVVVDSLDW